MGRAKPKQSLARLNVSRGGLHRSGGNQIDNAERNTDLGESESTKESTSTEATATATRANVPPASGRLDTEAEVERPQPREFEARACTLCVGVRPPGKNYSRVYSKHGRVRYCRCSFCGNTWSQEG